VKREIKDKWVRALLSGDYSQTEGTLRRGNTFCCLGVLCDLAEREGVVQRYTIGSHSRYGKDGVEGSLPTEVMEWAGLTKSDPDVPFRKIRSSLTNLNDNQELNFEQIADLIEKWL
jgi:hypothetical protein